MITVTIDVVLIPFMETGYLTCVSVQQLVFIIVPGTAIRWANVSLLGQ